MRLWGLVLGLLLFTLNAWAQGSDTVYRSVGPDGKVTYSQTPPAAGKVERKLEFQRLPASQLPPEVVKFRQEMERSIAAKQTAANAPPPAGLRLFSAAWCGYCKLAKAWLNAQSVPYQELDIDTPAGMTEFARTGGKGGIPLLVGPSVRLQGFSAEGYAAALKRS